MRLAYSPSGHPLRRGAGSDRPGVYGAGAIDIVTHICTMKCPKCGSTATKPKPADQFKCDQCGWKL